MGHYGPPQCLPAHPQGQELQARGKKVRGPVSDCHHTGADSRSCVCPQRNRAVWSLCRSWHGVRTHLNSQQWSIQERRGSGLVGSTSVERNRRSVEGAGLASTRMERAAAPAWIWERTEAWKGVENAGFAWVGMEKLGSQSSLRTSRREEDDALTMPGLCSFLLARAPQPFILEPQEVG